MKAYFDNHDLKSLFLPMSGIVLGILLAVADYNVNWMTASALVLSTILIYLYMASESKWLLPFSVASVVLTVYLSYGKILCLESLILLLFTYFILRLSKGAENSGRVMDGIVTVMIYGPVALIGSYFVCSHSFGSWVMLFPALSLGLLCAAAHGIEDGYGRNMLSLLIVSGVALMVVFSFMRMLDIIHFMYTATIPLFVSSLVNLYKKKGQATDTWRSLLVLYIFAMAVLTGLGLIAYLF